jgi:hypothetical protein
LLEEKKKEIVNQEKTDGGHGVLWGGGGGGTQKYGFMGKKKNLRRPIGRSISTVPLSVFHNTMRGDRTK